MLILGCPVKNRNLTNLRGKGTVFENHRKSVIQPSERRELRLHFAWTKVNKKCQKWSILASFWKPEACGQTMLPDRSVLIGQKLVENAENAKIQMCHIFCNWNWGWFGRNRRLITNDERSDAKKIDKKSFVIMFVRLREIVKNLAVKNSVRSRSAVVSCSSKTKIFAKFQNSTFSVWRKTQNYYKKKAQ